MSSADLPFVPLAAPHILADAAAGLTVYNWDPRRVREMAAGPAPSAIADAETAANGVRNVAFPDMEALAATLGSQTPGAPKPSVIASPIGTKVVKFLLVSAASGEGAPAQTAKPAATKRDRRRPAHRSLATTERKLRRKDLKRYAGVRSERIAQTFGNGALPPFLREPSALVPDRHTLERGVPAAPITAENRGASRLHPEEIATASEREENIRRLGSIEACFLRAVPNGNTQP